VFHLECHEHADDWAGHLAARLVAALTEQPQVRLCLPTGTTPLPIYQGVAGAVQAGLASFRRAEVWLLDEFGGVPADAAGRCDVMLRESLLDRVDLPPDRYHRPIPEAADLDAMCAAYDASLAGGLDLTLLGVGTNGHIGMNEPGTPPTSPTRRVELAPETIAASARYFGDGTRPTWGVTIGLAGLLASREVWLLATGAHKAEIVRDILLQPVSVERPASLLRSHPHCRLFLDAAAARLLPASVRPRG
jgi:glucosamine-6-phosphate deaminase